MTKHRTITNLVYANRDGADLCLDLHLPAASGGLLPVVVGLPGGGWRTCDKASVPRFLVDHGFALACVNYRISSNAIAPASVHDCKAAVSWIRANAHDYALRPDRMGVYGASAGGHLAALLGVSDGVKELESEGARLSPGTAVQAVCAVCGPMDLARIGIPEIRDQCPILYDVISQYLGGPIAERTELARLISPLTYVSDRCPPMLLMHGAADDRVPVEETTLFHKALQETGAKSSLSLIEGAGHGWLEEETKGEIISFFTETLT